MKQTIKYITGWGDKETISFDTVEEANAFLKGYAITYPSDEGYADFEEDFEE